MKFRLMMTAVVITALYPALVTPIGASAATSPKYVAVIDAGSSGTRLTLFADK
jgi:ABC-type Fe2+-enterobactin transport system substrate-binding protein